MSNARIGLVPWSERFLSTAPIPIAKGGEVTSDLKGVAGRSAGGRERDQRPSAGTGLGCASGRAGLANHVAGDDDLLNLCRALVQTKQAHIAVEALDAEFRDVARSA